MSFILDALKKLEKERQRGTVPDPLTAQDATAQETKRRRLWPYLLLVSLLLNAGLFVWWLAPWQSIKPDEVAHLPAGQQLESKAATSHSSTTLHKQPAKPRDIVKQNRPAQTKAGLQKKIPRIPPQTTDTTKPREVSLPVPQQTPTEGHVPPEPKPVNNSLDAVEDKVYNLNELPLSIKQSLPTFTITISLYSDDPASRMAKINGQMLREGQYLTAGLKLEEITPDGVIFSYKNYHFLVRLR